MRLILVIPVLYGGYRLRPVQLNRATRQILRAAGRLDSEKNTGHTPRASILAKPLPGSLAQGVVRFRYIPQPSVSGVSAASEKYASFQRSL